jgi:oligosaccharide repeat unit polymerase
MYTLFFTILVFFSVLIMLWSQPTGRRTVFEPGLVILGLFSFCYLVPAIAIIFGGNVLLVVDMLSVELISLYGCFFTMSFLFFYMILRRIHRVQVLPGFSLSIHWSPYRCFIGFILVFIIIKVILSYFGVGDTGDYSGQYIERKSIPQVIRQLLNVLSSLQWMFLYVLAASSFYSSSHKQKKSMRYLWIAVLIFIGDMLLTHSRSQFVTLTLVLIAAYTLYMRPVGLKKETTIAFLFVLILGVFSFLRETSTGISDIDWLSVLVPSEFASIYRNAMHLMTLQGTTEFVHSPGNSYLQSLIAFVPKQINEGKWDLATWYVGEYFPDHAAIGGGLAFGIVPEAIVNWGLSSIVFQAFIVAMIFRIAYFSAYKRRDSSPGLMVMFYLYCYSQIYPLIRSDSFAIMNSLILGFVVPFLIVFVLSRIRLMPRRYKRA